MKKLVEVSSQKSRTELTQANCHQNWFNKLYFELPERSRYLAMNFFQASQGFGMKSVGLSDSISCLRGFLWMEAAWRCFWLVSSELCAMTWRKSLSGHGPVMRSNSTKDLLDGEGKLQVQVPCKICIGCVLVATKLRLEVSVNDLIVSDSSIWKWTFQKFITNCRQRWWWSVEMIHWRYRYGGLEVEPEEFPQWMPWAQSDFLPLFINHFPKGSPSGFFERFGRCVCVCVFLYVFKASRSKDWISRDQDPRLVLTLLVSSCIRSSFLLCTMIGRLDRLDHWAMYPKNAPIMSEKSLNHFMFHSEKTSSNSSPYQ